MPLVSWEHATPSSVKTNHATLAMEFKREQVSLSKQGYDGLRE